MTIKSLPATEVKNRFGRVLREIAQTGGPIIVERGGKPVAVILSMDEYGRLQPQSAALENELVLIRESFGMWSGRADLDDKWLADGRSRWISAWNRE